MANWFVESDENDEPLEKAVIGEGVYSSREILADLMENDETKQCVVKVLGDLSELPMYGMMKNMKVDVLASMDSEGLVFTEAKINRLNHKLTRIKSKKD
ncbi:hypothetical protein [Alkalicoccobacillus plakortidis]|uniref:Uncharacterized protein n=1 Tax=Alkalicoccobacillus plakortidis TaxID=444060 RepID=A0ABT0XNH1_9BACI|nr:hypothetical protein [Alkalicoccobacillus plakortidis]MCM2677450.1 hypothetical protein [Alkalicoccobacillus plakortidis]